MGRQIKNFKILYINFFFQVRVVLGPPWRERSAAPDPDPLHTEPKTHTEEEETSDDEQRESKSPRDITEDNPVLGQPRS